MALSRRSVQRMSGSIWPGFVDAMTALLLVLMFVLTIFMIVQYVLRETITGQEDELNTLATEITTLAEALGLEQQRVSQLEDEAVRLNATLSDAEAMAEAQSAMIARLQGDVADRDAELAERAAQITTFEAQVATLLAERDAAVAEGEALAEERDRLISDQEALQLAVARARAEIDAQAEAARLAAARREALEALTAELESEVESTSASLANALARLEAAEGELARIDELETQLSEEEAARLAEAAAAQALRQRLENADAELTAMTLALEEQRREAEETLTLLAAARTAEEDLTERLAAALADREDLQGDAESLRAEIAALREQTGDEEELRDQLAAALAARAAAETDADEALSEAERRAALLAAANERLAQEEALSAEGQRRVALLSEQVTSLRNQLDSLQGLLDAADERDANARVRIESLGSQLNVALARAASEGQRRAQLEEAERLRLEEEARRLAEEAEELERYRSEFFGELRDVLGDVEGVQIVGDRFLFSSEVLFDVGSADLAPAGREQIARVSEIMSDVADRIPDGIDWILRVDGHTDDTPITGGRFADNWELSQARALSVVRYMVNQLGFPPDHLAATGFGEYRPVAEGNSEDARARNRRIELKLTER